MHEDQIPIGSGLNVPCIKICTWVKCLLRFYSVQQWCIILALTLIQEVTVHNGTCCHKGHDLDVVPALSVAYQWPGTNIINRILMNYARKRCILSGSSQPTRDTAGSIWNKQRWPQLSKINSLRLGNDKAIYIYWGGGWCWSTAEWSQSAFTFWGLQYRKWRLKVKRKQTLSCLTLTTHCCVMTTCYCDVI